MASVARISIVATAALLYVGTPRLAHGKRCDRVIPIEQRDFDHDGHGKRYKEEKGKEIGCDGVCHTLSRDQKGWKWRRMEVHKRCSASGCHKRPRQVRKCSSLSGTDRRVCSTCHTKKRPAPDAPVAPSDFASKYAHGKHLATTTGKACQACHGGGPSNLPPARKPTAPGHPYCVDCHKSDSRPAMTECSGCHADPGQKPMSISRPVNAFAMRGAFDHLGHERQRQDKNKSGQRRTRPSGAGECKTCHANLAGIQRESNLPLPTMQGCYTNCHNGKDSFDALSSTCSRCHKGAGLRPEELPDLAIAAAARKPYRHQQHKREGLALEPCAACHALDASFQPLPPTRDKPHARCVTCHAEDFYKPAPTTCGACHTDSAPWTAQKAALAGGQKTTGQKPTRDRSEFSWDRSAGFSHSGHIGAYQGQGVKSDETCGRCHSQIFKQGTPSDVNAGGALSGALPGALSDGHTACATCHGRAATPPKPTMAECNGCHRLGPATVPAPGEWNVAAKFTHASHERDPRTQGQTTPCITCHQSAASATSLAAVGRPTMRSCDACHNGKQAFKTTGFGCLRCHDGKKP